MGLSQRLACRVVGVSRSAYGYAKNHARNLQGDKYAAVRDWLVAWAAHHPRWGYRRAWIKAREAGCHVGRDVIRRLWRQEGLRVFPRRKTKRRNRITTPRMNPATCPNDVWALDFQFDSDFFGKTMKICNIVDEFTREHIAFTVNRMITAHDVVELLDVTVVNRGTRPRVIRMDNGPEFISTTLATWVTEDTDTTCHFIPPGQPWHNGFIESFHNRLRDELLEQDLFDNVTHLEKCLTQWSHRYNTYHPHSSLGYIPPKEYANQWHTNQKAP